MHEDLMRLDRVDQLDRDVASRQRRMESLQRKLQEAELAVASAEQKLAEKESAVAENRESQRVLQRKLSDYRSNRSSAERLLETGQGDPEAAERQVQRCSVLIDEAETEMLELLEEQDVREESQGACAGELTSTQEALAALVEQVPIETATLQQEVATKTQERAAVHEELPRDIKSRYDHWRARNKWAVARIADKTCDACQMDVQAQHLADLKRGLIAPCRRCHRWLIPPQRSSEA